MTATLPIREVRPAAEQEKQQLIHDLRLRIKELTALHQAAWILQRTQKTRAEILQVIAESLPPAYQYPEITAARVAVGAEEYATPDFRPTPWMQRAAFQTGNGLDGAIEVAYREDRPAAAEGPFQAEERFLIDSLAEMLRAHLDRSEALRALRDSEERFRCLSACSPVGIFLTDLLGRVTYTNPHGREIFGMTLRETLDEGWTQSIHPDDRAWVAPAWLRTVRETREFAGEFRIRTARGESRWVHLRRSPMRSDLGQLTGHVGTVEDITGRKQLEQQFQQAQKMEALGQLAGGVAHDFNNILTAIAGYTDLAMRRLPPDDPLLRNLQEIAQASERAAGLTRQLLVFSRRQERQLRVLDLNTVVTDAEKMLRRLIGEDIALVTELAADLGRVKADPGQIEQVIMNLAVNARDAMPQGGQITIRTANVTVPAGGAPPVLIPQLRDEGSSPPGHYALLSVADTGAGMSDEVKKHLFEPFFTTKPSGKGTGLGLATCFGIVQQSGGHIRVKSELGCGTTINICLPQVSRETQPACQQPEAQPMTELPRGTETVLLVEDDLSLRGLASLLLNGLGYRVLQASDGQEALRLVQAQTGQRIDIVVTDVVMPHMGGKELADRMHAVSPATKLLFCSGYTDDVIARNGIPADGVPFLQKPYTPPVLARRIREILNAAAGNG